jgi:integrase
MLEGWRDRLVQRTPRNRARKILTCLKSILAEAQRRGLIAHNPAQPVGIKIQKRHEEKVEVGVHIPDKPDIQQILATVKGHHRPLIVTAILTGMRASELRGLAWDAVDFDKETITVRQRADEWGVIGSPKSKAGRRTIPMSPTVVNTLKEWKLVCPKGELNLVFPNTLGKVEPLSNIAQRVWRPLQVKTGLIDEGGEPRFNFHTLRHFAASQWIALGFSPKKLQALLGHSSVQMTFDRYGHLFPSRRPRQVRQERDRVGRLDIKSKRPGRAPQWRGSFFMRQSCETAPGDLIEVVDLA